MFFNAKFDKNLHNCENLSKLSSGAILEANYLCKFYDFYLNVEKHLKYVIQILTWPNFYMIEQLSEIGPWLKQIQGKVAILLCNDFIKVSPARL